MDTCAKRLRGPALGVILAAGVLVLSGRFAVEAGNPHGAYYSSDTNKSSGSSRCLTRIRASGPRTRTD
jgi:hypothetical protein